MKRSKHSLSNYKLLTCDMGQLIPIGLQEVLPGDTFQQATSALIRVSPLLAPVMHPVRVRIHHWYVPTRLIWDDFTKFITGGPDGMDASVYPTITLGGGSGTPVGSVLDYLGVPTGVNNLVVSALPLRAYQTIYNEWYRDQDLTTLAAVSKASGNDATTTGAMQYVAWEKDYFTSARPWTQKGPAVTMPLGSIAPVFQENRPAGAGSSLSLGREAVTGNLSVANAGNYDATTQLMTDLAQATSASINDLREAFALQRYEEARARYGSRFTEYLAYLGIRSSDARLQRPEYLGGGKQTIQFSEVLQSGVTTSGATAGVGNMAGHGIGALRSNRYRRFFEEHGYVMTLMSVLPKTMYVQGLARHWNRRIKEDYWQKELEHIGQQEIRNKEVYAAHATPEGVFGYQDRYDEYRRCESTVAGEFRTTLNYWHYARIFASDPALNSTFVVSNPTKRVNASQSTNVLWVMANHSIQARRLVASTGNSFLY